MTRAFAILVELFYGFIGRTHHSFTNCEWDNELPVLCNATQLCTLHSTNVMISGSRAEEKNAKQSEPGTLFEDACTKVSRRDRESPIRVPDWPQDI